MPNPPVHPTPPTPASQASLDAWALSQLAELGNQQQRRELRVVQAQGRQITVDGKSLLNLAGNDYLGLSSHPHLIASAIAATEQFGVGAGASRLVCGTWPLHQQVEEQFAAFKHAQACLLLPTGYSANLAALTTLAGPGDVVVLDKLVHASLIDAARASGAQVRTYPHLQLQRAEHLLTRHTTGRRLLVTDSVFSMDGHCADLPALCDLADRCDASLIVDEAHGTGILGDDGSGLASMQGVAHRIYTSGSGGVVISTASKALGSLGGLITASRPVIDLILNKARPFIYSTAVPPAQCAAILAALDVIRDEPHRRQRLSELALRLRLALRDAGWAVDTQGIATPIIPLIVGDERSAIERSKQLVSHGIFAPAIRPPTVAPGTSRVRLSLRADLSDDDLCQLLHAIASPTR